MRIPSWLWNNGPTLYSGRVLEGAWEYNLPVHMCFVDLKKVYNRGPTGVPTGISAVDLQCSLDQSELSVK